jgi:hypothetical protein
MSQHLKLCSALTKSHPVEYRHELTSRVNGDGAQHSAAGAQSDDCGANVTRHVADYSALKLLCVHSARTCDVRECADTSNRV